MKYTITLTDLTASEAAHVLNSIEGGEHVKVTTDRENVVLFKANETNTAPPIGSAVAIAAAQNVVAANTNAGDVDSILNASTNELLKSTNTGELDSAGLPWDERIHSGSKKKNADGKWKLRKNVDEALVKSVEAENQGAAQPAFLQNQPAPAQQAAHAIAPAIVPATLVANAAPPAPAAPLPAMNQPPARDFSGLMLQISKLFAAKQITPDYPTTIVQRVNAGFGVDIKTLTDVANDPRMVEYSWQCLEVDGKAA